MLMVKAVQKYYFVVETTYPENIYFKKSDVISKDIDKSQVITTLTFESNSRLQQNIAKV